ncbi:MAG: hypothetical protein J6M05_06135 [Cardiobacteriaceae bacterium]|nr:hypothetical protein [Cardiobacteriaceae bacterium]
MKLISKTETATVFLVDSKTIELITRCFDSVVTDLISDDIHTRIGCNIQEFIFVYDEIRCIKNNLLEIPNKYLFILYCTICDSIHAIGMKNITSEEEQHIEEIISFLQTFVK